MKKVLFIVPYPTGFAPSQRFRFEQYFGLLKAQSVDFEISSFWTQKAWAILYQKQNVITKAAFLFLGYFNRCILLLHIQKFDFVFIHREATPLGPPVIEYIISRILKMKVIYDFDDAIWLPNTSKQNSLAQYFKYHKKVNSICKWSWKVSCGNEFLAEHAKKFNQNVFINPTTIDTKYHISRGHVQVNKKVTIGWTGSHSTVKYLVPMTPIISQLLKDHALEFIVISNEDPLLDLENYQFIQWNKEKEIEQLDKIDIGIMPLDDTIWEHGKCGFKALQYMALEKATVVSAVGVNNEIIEHEENGYLCPSEKDWITYLSKLISNETLRKSMGRKGRKTILDNYSVESNSELFLSFFE